MEEIAQASLYLSLAIASIPACKYIFYPIVKSTFLDNDEFELTKTSLNVYKEVYAKTVEKRGNVAIELGKAGKNGDEIADIVNKTLPLPETIKIDGGKDTE